MYFVDVYVLFATQVCARSWHVCYSTRPELSVAPYLQRHGLIWLRCVHNGENYCNVCTMGRMTAMCTQCGG